MLKGLHILAVQSDNQIDDKMVKILKSNKKIIVNFILMNSGKIFKN